MARLLWTLKQRVGPPPRASHVAVFDAPRRRTIVFGGESLQGNLFGDTWEWDGENWTQVNDIGPVARFGAAMAFDASRARAVLFGGTDGNRQELGDTWELDDTDWTQLADDGPPPRSGHAMIFDSTRARVLLFGGIAGNTAFGDTWEWNGDEWVQLDDAGPTPRHAHAMAFDDARDRVVLFGGLSGESVFADTWEFDGESWTQVADFGPPACFGASLHFAARRSRLFGGASSLVGDVEIFGRTWEWNGRHWTIRQDLGPGPRRSHTIVFDAPRARGVFFGGTTSVPDAQSATASGDTWEQFEQAAAGEPQEPEPRRDLSGVVRDFFTRAPLAGATLTLDGQPGLAAVSDSDGSYAFARVSPAQALVVVASRPGHRETRNDVGLVAASAVIADVFLVTTADLAAQAVAVAVTLTPDSGAIFVDLRNEVGEPREGVPAADIGLAPIFDAVLEFDGPFFFGASGSLDPSLTSSVTVDGQARAAFLNVPPAPYQLTVSTTDDPPQNVSVNLVVTTSGVTLTSR